MAILLVLAACGNNGGGGIYEDAFAADPTPMPEVMPTPPPDYSSPGRWDDAFQEAEIVVLPASMLTGLPVEEYIRIRRPVAVVINNIHRALPQSGIASADIIYEVLSEGDVTRLIGIFQSDIPDQIGPVRSARDYFVDFAFNHDAIFVHHGASPSGYSRIRGQGIHVMDGMALEGSVFWRDRTYPAWHHNSGTRPMEHSSYTGWERMAQHIDSRSIREWISYEERYGFQFGAIPANIVGHATGNLAGGSTATAEELSESTAEDAASNTARRILVPFSPNYIRTFIFDEDSGLYLVENRDGAHRDANTEAQVSVTNVLIQLTGKRVIAGDEAGRRVVDTIGSGTGFLATGGYYFPVRWTKDSHSSPMQWFFDDGSPLMLSPGRTWINVFQTTGTVTFE